VKHVDCKPSSQSISPLNNLIPFHTHCLYFSRLRLPYPTFTATAIYSGCSYHLLDVCTLLDQGALINDCTIHTTLCAYRYGT